METLELITTNPELAKNLRLEVTGADLLAFAEYVHRQAEDARPDPVPEEEYLTPAEMAKALKVSLVTLWNWDKKGITNPIKIGNQKRYRRSDLIEMMQRGA